MSLKLSILGLPGAGKGTQADKLSETYGIPHISMGDILRNNKEFETESGETVGEIIDAGNPVTAKTCATLLSTRLDEPDCADGFVLDGFPRFQEQAEIMDDVTGIDAILLIKVDEDNILERLTKRRICPDCDASYHLKFDPPEQDEICDNCGTELVQREDDTAEKIEERISWQRDGIEEVLTYFDGDEDTPVEVVNGNPPISEVWNNVQEVVEKHVN